MIADWSQLQVLALGSSQGDDQVAWKVADRLAADAAWPYRIHKLASPAELIAHLQTGAPTVIIDACRCSGTDSGTVIRLDADRLRESQASGRSTHGLSLADAIPLARALGALPQWLVILAVEIGPIRPGPELTPAGRDAVLVLEQGLRSEIAGATAVRG